MAGQQENNRVDGRSNSVTSTRKQQSAAKQCMPFKRYIKITQSIPETQSLGVQ